MKRKSYLIRDCWHDRLERPENGAQGDSDEHEKEEKGEHSPSRWHLGHHLGVDNKRQAGTTLWPRQVWDTFYYFPHCLGRRWEAIKFFAIRANHFYDKNQIKENQHRCKNLENHPYLDNCLHRCLRVVGHESQDSKNHESGKHGSHRVSNGNHECVQLEFVRV